VPAAPVFIYFFNAANQFFELAFFINKDYKVRTTNDRLAVW